ncbi:hypothetical protein Mapa_010151 [Marchantia paleacea]|nr:hypothetical protein Mapa_010151 [Marchantia paleacea]
MLTDCCNEQTVSPISTQNGMGHYSHYQESMIHDVKDILTRLIHSNYEKNKCTLRKCESFHNMKPSNSLYSWSNTFPQHDAALDADYLVVRKRNWR